MLPGVLWVLCDFVDSTRMVAGYGAVGSVGIVWFCGFCGELVWCRGLYDYCMGL